MNHLQKKIVEYFENAKKEGNVITLKRTVSNKDYEFLILFTEKHYQLEASMSHLSSQPILISNIHDNLGFQTTIEDNRIKITSEHSDDDLFLLTRRMERYLKFLLLACGDEDILFYELFPKKKGTH